MILAEERTRASSSCISEWAIPTASLEMQEEDFFFHQMVKQSVER